VEIQKESEDRDIWKGMITSIDTVTQGSIMFRKKKKEDGYNVEQNTKTYRFFGFWVGMLPHS